MVPADLEGLKKRIVQFVSTPPAAPESLESMDKRDWYVILFRRPERRSLEVANCLRWVLLCCNVLGCVMLRYVALCSIAQFCGVVAYIVSVVR